jgi:hypothetical protein
MLAKRFSPFYKNFAPKKVLQILSRTIFSKTPQKSLYYIRFKRFSRREETEQEFYLSEAESYRWNEHDRMILQLESRSVPNQNLPKFMKELLDYSYALRKYKHYIKGYNYAARFFIDNIKSFTNEEFVNFAKIFGDVEYNRPNGEPFWSLIAEEVVRRELNKDEIIQFLSISILKYENIKLWGEILEKVQRMSLSQQDYVSLASVSGIKGVNIPENLWNSIANSINTIEISKLSEEELEKLLYATYHIYNGSSNTQIGFLEPLFSKLQKYYEDNQFKLSPNTLLLFSIIYKYVAKLENDGITKLIIEVSQKYAVADEKAKLDFYKEFMKWCDVNPQLVKNLSSNIQVMGKGFKLPTAEVVTTFNSLLRESNWNDPKEHGQAINNFWEQYGPKIGINPSSVASSGFSSHSSQEQAKH